MGYYSYLSGRIVVEPPVRRDALPVDSRFLDGIWSDVCYEFSNAAVVAIVPAETEERVKAYKLEAHLRGAVLEVRALGSDIGAGWIVREGEEQGDVARYRVDKAGQVVGERAVLTWPDGTVADLSN